MTAVVGGIWQDDLLGRLDDAAFIATLLRNRSAELVRQEARRSFVLNIDVPWGGGKTFFLRRLKEQLALNHVAVYVDAWADDFAEDPLIAVMAAIDAEIRSKLPPKGPVIRQLNKVGGKAGKVAWAVGKGLARRAAGAVFTTAAVEAVEGIISAAPDIAKATAETADEAATSAVDALTAADAIHSIEKFSETKGVVEDFKADVSKLVTLLEEKQGVASPLCVLIDELDRCRPTYAISLLERIKHLFEMPNVVFVVATDTEQLAHTVRAVYGAGFESKRYLKRFFDRTFEFEAPSPAAFVSELLRRQPLKNFHAPPNLALPDFLSDFFTAYHDRTKDLRAIGQMLDVLKTVGDAWENPAPIVTLIFLPLLAAHYEGKADIPPAKIFDQYLPSNMGFDYYRIRDYHYRDQQRLPCSHAATSLWNVASSQPMLAATHRENLTSSAETFLRDTLLDELHKRFEKNPGHQGATMSLITQYPRIIRQAGRLTGIA